MLYIAGDHGGFEFKEQLKKYFDKNNIVYKDFGPFRLDPKDDYPDFTKLVAREISKNPRQNGILLCRSGQGVNMLANKYKNVRAALVWNAAEAQKSRSDNLANVLSLPIDYISKKAAYNIVTTWLNTPLGKEPRHVRRVKKINVIEKQNFK